MGFWTLLEVASMPVLQVLIIGLVGAFLATDYCNLLPADARRYMNKVVFMVFTPSLIFSSLAETVTLEDIISWWFMPINIGLTFLFGGVLGWIVVKTLKPKPHLDGLIIATCSTGNLGNLMLIIVPAICNEKGSPFGDRNVCATVGLSYSSFSMALGGFYIWTYTYQLIRQSSVKYKALALEVEKEEADKVPNKDLYANPNTHLLLDHPEKKDHLAIPINPVLQDDDKESNLAIVSNDPGSAGKLQLGDAAAGKALSWERIKEMLHQILEELLAPPTLAAILGFVFGASTWLKNLLVGDGAPLHVIQDSIELLGDGTIPCITLILGGNLTRGLRSARIKPIVIVGVLIVRYVIQPAIGIGVVKAASHLGFLPSDPLFHFILMVQFTLPPAMNISTMTELFDVGQEECSVLFLWTYLVAALALTVWSTIFLWTLS
ncbi:Membrane transport protein [Dillenia turbinata]|uniref:Membrane transport protein n=1 Tax=Dillenia turbinata TaxID=194707 RepID=A0AAN8V2L6_9MAGN